MDKEKDMEIKNADEILAHLAECEEMCLISTVYSLKQGGDFAKAGHVRWLLDCADICNLARKYFIRDSEYAGDILNLCSYVCDDCAESCETFFEDKNMTDCANVCRSCAETCRSVVEKDMEEIEEEE